MKGFSKEFIIVNEEPHMLEMNTIPGLTTEKFNSATSQSRKFH
jgi:hypothetical protein